MRVVSLLAALWLAFAAIYGQDSSKTDPAPPPDKQPAQKQKAVVVNQPLLVLKASPDRARGTKRTLADLATKKKGDWGPYATEGLTNKDVEEAGQTVGRSHIPKHLRYKFTATPPRPRRSSSSTVRTWSELQRFFELRRGSETYRRIKHVNRQNISPMRTGMSHGAPATPRRYVR
jgi:hypothetical protein